MASNSEDLLRGDDTEGILAAVVSDILAELNDLETDSHFHNILRLFNGWAIFLSLQVKRNVIVGNKHDIYELLHELPNNLRLKILVN